MASRCPLCHGRIIKAAEGDRCMNARCENAKGLTQAEGIPCPRCGERATYSGLDLYGQPHYVCQSCGNKRKLSE